MSRSLTSIRQIVSTDWLISVLIYSPCCPLPLHFWRPHSLDPRHNTSPSRPGHPRIRAAAWSSARLIFGWLRPSGNSGGSGEGLESGGRGGGGVVIDLTFWHSVTNWTQQAAIHDDKSSYQFVCLSFFLSVTLSFLLSVYHSVFPSFCLLVRLSVCLPWFVFPSFCLPLCLSFFLSTSPSVCLSALVCFSFFLSTTLSFLLSVY